ncbi:MAG: ATP-dependent zinc protease [Thermodesulfobacteriota bacterium]
MTFSSRIRCGFRVLAGLLLLVLVCGCYPQVMVATRAQHQTFTDLMEREREQLERMRHLGSRLESMQTALLESHTEEVHTLRRRMDAQEDELQTLRSKIEKLRQDAEKSGDARYIAGSDLVSLQKHDNGGAPSAPSRVTDSSGKQVVGSEEHIFLSPPGKVFPARIDTGATTSSLDARNIERFERNGEPWVRFTILDPETEEELDLERKVVRNVRIIQAVEENKEKRQVVELQITLGNTTRSAEFTLSDRSHMEFPVLVGRNILMDSMSVDVSKKYISNPLQSQSRDNTGSQK